jgi:hypothetical protein
MLCVLWACEGDGDGEFEIDLRMTVKTEIEGMAQGKIEVGMVAKMEIEVCVGVCA